MNPEELQAIKDRNAKRSAVKMQATAGPWRNDRGARVCFTENAGFGSEQIIFDGQHLGGKPADVAFCVEARNDPVEKDVRLLLEEIEHLNKLLNESQSNEYRRTEPIQHVTRTGLNELPLPINPVGFEGPKRVIPTGGSSTAKAGKK